MFNTKNILSFLRENDYESSIDVKHYSDSYQFLNSHQRSKLNGIDNAINQLVHIIEHSTNWKFIPPNTFTYLSEYKYNRRHGQIEYVINKVSSNNEGYRVLDNNSEREIIFALNYQVELNKLHKLQQRKKRILDSVSNSVEEYNKKVLPFTRLTPTVSLNNKKNVDEYLDYKSEEFESSYGVYGILCLVKFLNDLTNSESFVNVYNAYRTSDMAPVLLQDIIEWSGTYSFIGQRLLDYIAEEKMKTSINQDRFTF